MKKNFEEKKTEFTLNEAKVIPIVREEVKVEKRKRETGITRIRKIVHEKVETVDEPVFNESVEVERVPVNKIVERALPARDENGTMIVPVYEEIVVAEKRLLLREELHIRKRIEKNRKTEQIILRNEEAVVEHIETSGHADQDSGEEKLPGPAVRRAV